jgi:uncharacterized protein (DUF927 family)
MDAAFDKFAPIPAEEMAAAPPARPAVEDGELVSPVPDDAPPAPSLHHTLGNASAVWKYRDLNGALLFEVHRFDTQQGKQILPLTLWRMSGGALRWRFKGVPAPRALYGLEKLATCPDAPVIVCEGEKAADAAACIFPNSVCITSMGGSQAASKTDWTPLSGRRALIWPDADEPGRKYAAEVARTLHALECEVSIIDAMALAGITPDGGKREPEKGWDAANAVTEWQDLGALHRAVHGLATALDTGPAFVSWGDFTMSAKGLTKRKTRASTQDDNAEPGSEWIAAPLEIVGRARDPHGLGWGRFLRWRDPDERLHEQFVSDGALHRDPAGLCSGLAESGLTIARNQQRAFVTYIAGANTHGRVTLVHRTGWHEVNGHLVFALPTENIGPKGAGSIILDAAAHGPYETCGTLMDWQNRVAMLANDHALAVLSISAALAGPLLHLAGQEGGGLNFFGPSSKGKTTLLKLAASVWGRGSSPGYVRAWRATANGLEGAAASATDTALVLDELGQVEARDAAAAMYSLANGTGKARATREGALREPKSWRALILSSGEIPTETKLGEERGRKARAGQLVRMLDIPADRGLGFGAFDNAGPDGDAAALSKRFKDAAISAYGTAGPEFVRRIIAENVTGEYLCPIIFGFIFRHVPAGADGQVDRAAQRLGLIAAAGEVATLLGVTPWDAGVAEAAAAWALARWIEGRGGTEPAEERQAISQVRLFIEQHGESRFERLDGSDARQVINRAGWCKGSGAEREWWVSPEVWRVEVCAGIDATMAARTLCGCGMLRRQSASTFQCSVKVEGIAKRAYVLTADILQGGSDAS